jgi:hypothetical protein
MSDVPQEERDREVAITPDELRNLHEISRDIHAGINGWFNPPSGVIAKSGIEMFDNLVAQMPKLSHGLNALRDKIQEIWDRAGFDYKIADPKIPSDQIGVTCAELLTLAQVRAQISGGINEWLHPEKIVPESGTDHLAYLMKRLDIISDALTSITPTLDGIWDRHKRKQEV